MNTKRIFNFLAPALACALVFYGPATAQTSPSLISFQGRLTDNLNNPLAGSYNFDFAIYAAQTGGAALWTETQNGITVANGVLMAELGSSSPIPESVFSSAQRYLEITVNGTTLAPRQRLLSVPYAMNAQTLNGRGFSALVSTDAAQVISGAKTFTTDISMSGTARLTNLAAPSAAGDAANKAYVDGITVAAQGSVLSSTQTFTGRNTFTNQVTISSDIYVGAGRINLSGTFVTTQAGLLDAAKLANTVPNAALDSSSVTKRGNSFNGPGQLVLLNAFSRLPAVDGSLLLNVTAGSVNAASVQPGTFISGVLLPAAQVQPGALGSEVIASSLAAGSVYPDNLAAGVYNIDVLGNAGTVSNGLYSTASYFDPPWLTGLSSGKVDLSTVTAELALKADSSAVLTNDASVPSALVNLSTVTTALAGKLSNTATIPQTLVNLSTVTAALAGKISSGSSISPALVNLSTVTSALALKADSASVLFNYAAVPSDLVDLSTVTSALALKADSSAVLVNNASVPAELIDLSTVAAALTGKLSNTAGVPQSLVDLSTVTTALAGKLSNSAPVSPELIDLSTVTAELILKADASAVLANNATVPAGLIDLSTVAAALTGKLSATGDGSAVTNITAANISAGNLGSSVVASSLAVNSVYTESLRDGSLSFSKIGINSCGAGEVLRRNASNSGWICGPDEGGVAGTFNLAPASPLTDVSANPSVYVNDTGGGNFLHFLENGVDKFAVSNSGLITSGSIGAAQVTAGPLPSDVIAASVAVNSVYPESVKAGSYNIDVLGNAGTVSNGIYSTGLYSDPAWITGLSTGKIDLSTVTAALDTKADNSAVTSTLAGKAVYADVIAATTTIAGNLAGEAADRIAGDNAISLDTTTLAGDLAAGLAARSGLAEANTFTSSQTITDARGLYANRQTLSAGVEISSEAAASLGAGVRISTNVYIVGISSAARYYGDGSTLTGIVTTAKWVGYSATALNGNRAGYASANTECSAAYAGAHVCTNGEILFSINSGLLGANFPLNVPLWINNGPPGYTANANDCNGWASSAVGDYGALWNRVGAGDGFGSLQPCNATAKFACCK